MDFEVFKGDKAKKYAEKHNLEFLGGGFAKYPWAQLQPGDLFAIPLEKLKRPDYRPSCPPRLKEQGMKFKTLLRQDLGKLFVKRIA